MLREIHKETPMQRKVGLAIALLFAVATVANASSVIVVGPHLLLPNTPGQTIQILVTGNDTTVQGMNFTSVIGDGGSIFGGVDDVVPTMTADIITGAVFAPDGANAVNQNPGFVFGIGLAPWSVTTVSTNTGFGPFNRLNNGLLATLTIDTTGFTTGTWALSLDDPNVGTTDWAGSAEAPSITNGSITIVPEPTSVVLGLFAAAGLGAVAIRRRTRKA
jgi:hypothetical protein